MDYQQVVREQIDSLQKMQKQMFAKAVIDVDSVCKVAETIVMLCREIRNIPSSK